jgi:hypothetical protein
MMCEVFRALISLLCLLLEEIEDTKGVIRIRSLSLDTYVFSLKQNEQCDNLKLALQTFDYDEEKFENTKGASRSRNSNTKGASRSRNSNTKGASRSRNSNTKGAEAVILSRTNKNTIPKR